MSDAAQERPGFTLDRPGLFVLPGIPADWRAIEVPSDRGRLFQLHPSAEDAGIFIHAVPRSGEIGSHQARDAVAGFVRQYRLRYPISILELPDSDTDTDTGQRAAAQFRRPATDEHSEFDCVVMCIVRPQLALLCTVTAEPGSPSVDVAERLFAAIQPAG